MIRRIAADDADLLRQMRLRALSDSPESFGSTYAAEAAFSEQTWRERAALAATGSDRAMFLAFEGTECVGIAGAMEDDLGADKQLISMWVAPSHRGTGLARDLVEAVLSWAAGGGARDVGLWVTRGNERAQRLYERLGFVVTGDVAPLPWDPCKDELRMIKTIGSATAAK